MAHRPPGAAARDLETLIELGRRGFKVYSAHGERDLANADDMFILRIEVAQAAKASDDMSRRIKRRFATYREQGRMTGGPRHFGFPGKEYCATNIPAVNIDLRHVST